MTEMDDYETPENLPAEGLKEVVLEALVQLHVDFAGLGTLNKAGPLLHQLMELAYYAELRSDARAMNDRRGMTNPELH